MKKLVIWDFDGVIADSEKLWVSVWVELLEKEKRLKLTKEEQLEGANDNNTIITEITTFIMFFRCK